jgi:hypothetical protein
MLLSFQMNVNRRLVNLSLLLFVVLAICTAVVAQTGATRKVDEFVGEVDEEDLLARLDNFAIALNDDPKSQGQIIVYRTRRDGPSVSHRHLLRAKDYLVRQRHIDASRIVTVDGGMTGCLSYELWIVPPGASPPERRFAYKYPLKRRRI